MLEDREDAGRKLAFKIKGVIKGSFETSLKRHSGNQASPEHPESPTAIRDSGQARMTKDKDYSVVGIVRGGVVVAKVIADSLNAKLRAIVVRKIGAPLNPEMAIGAVGSGKITYWDENLIKKLNVETKYRSSALKEKFREVKMLEEKFSINKDSLEFENKRVIIVDDGVATGATVLCANRVIKRKKPKELILGTPVIAKDSYEYIKNYFDQIIVLEIAENFSAVGQFYRDFPQVEDYEVNSRLR